jgi:hypothetical protein
MTVVLGQPIADLVMHHDNIHAVAACPDGVKLMRPLSGAWVSTLWGTAPLRPAQSVCPVHTSDYVVGVADGVNPQRAFLLAANGGSLTTLYTASPTAPAWEWHTHEQDLLTGEVVDGSLSGGLVYISLVTGAVTTPGSRPVNTFAQDPLDGSWVIAGSSGLFRLDRQGRVTTLRAASTGSYSQPVFDRAAGRGVIVTGTGGTLLRLDRQGNAIASYPGAYLGVRCDFHAGRNLATGRQPGGLNHWGFLLDFPGEGGRAYQVGLSMTGFHPGIALGGRTIPLTPDPLLVLSVTGGLGQMFFRHARILDAGGKAWAGLDLSALGNTVKGVRIWVAAVTFSPAAPSGIATISRPAILVLD